MSVAEIGWISICTGRPWTACGHSCLPSGWSSVVGGGPGLRWRCWCYQRPCGLMPGVSPPLWRMQIWMCVGGGPDCSDNNRQAGGRVLMLADGVTPLWFVTTKTFGLCSYWFFFYSKCIFCSCFVFVFSKINHLYGKTCETFQTQRVILLIWKWEV